MARQLAVDHGAHVVAAARRAERLEELQAEAASSKGSITPCVADVSKMIDRAEIVAACNDKPLYGLILNAAITDLTPFDEGKMSSYRVMVETNVTANIELIHALLPSLENRPDGAEIMLVASLGGLTPAPYQAVYAGTKAFLINFGLSLREELKERNISVTVLAPGGIKTEMTDIAGMKALERGMEPADKIARLAIEALKSRRGLVAPGLMAKSSAVLARYLPRRLVAGVTADAYRDSMDAAD